ncbi:MAG TPA: tetratricopeptide repeat protein [Bryobacteraceae bacterium]|nr:tetratricopeptide repeat protein [Bryobacteraceae bacterium]
MRLPALGFAVALVCVAAQDGYVGATACSGCHKAEYTGFRQTPMARSLQPISRNAAPEFRTPRAFLHSKTGRGYRISGQNALLIHESATQNGRVTYTDSRRLSYAIGSGTHARSFLTDRPGRLYQAPVTYFSQSRRWDMSPGYDTDSYVGFSRRVTANCLFCHAGRVDVQNQAGDLFQTPPFAETGIGCERCHGPGQGHLTGRPGAIVNPAKLSSERRDEICEQCHLFGAARVSQPGKSPAGYRPGKPLGDVLAIYVYDAAIAGDASVTSHPLEMKQSKCRQKSAGKLWCGSCHEVHRTLPAAGSAAFYRNRCLNCHPKEACNRRAEPASTAHRDNDCVACHMPKRPVVESAHVTFTDHRIMRSPTSPAANQERSIAKLRLILPAQQDDPVTATRNLGFAYAEIASSTGENIFFRKAVELLQPLRGTSIADAMFWQTVGEAELALGEAIQAQEAFQTAAGLDPGAASAHYGSGYLFQLQGRRAEAIQAYERALRADPYKAEAWSNLAAAYLEAGMKAKALEALETALKLEPGNLGWRATLQKMKIRK